MPVEHDSPALWCQPLEWFINKGYRQAEHGWEVPPDIPGGTKGPGFVNNEMIGRPYLPHRWVYRTEWLIPYDPSKVEQSAEVDLIKKLRKAVKKQHEHIRSLQAVFSRTMHAILCLDTNDRRIFVEENLALTSLLAPTGVEETSFTDSDVGHVVHVVGPDCQGRYDHLLETMRVAAVCEEDKIIDLFMEPPGESPEAVSFFFGSVQRLKP